MHRWVLAFALPLIAARAHAVAPYPPPSCAPPARVDETFTVSGVQVDVHTPVGPVRGQILCLPGWNFSRDDVCARSRFCERALAAGFVLIQPEMGKTVYAEEAFPDTRPEMAHQRTRKWVVDTLIKRLQRDHGLLAPGGANYLYGISTGGRGVGLLALHTRGIFAAAAALSGDLDMIEEPRDPLLIAAYGPMEVHPERWRGEDNPARHVKRIRIPFFLATGDKDTVVPPDQARHFAARLREAHPELPVELHEVPGGGHDYATWDSQSEAVLAFFAAHPPTPGR